MGTSPILSHDQLRGTLAKSGSRAAGFGGTPLACAAALATLEVIEGEALVERSAEVGTEFAGRLRGFVEKYEHVTDVRGRGLMLGIVLDQPAGPLCKMTADMGLLTLAMAENVVRLLPPLNIKDAEIEEALEILDDCLAEWHGVAANDMEESETPAVAEEEAPEPEEEAAVAPAENGTLPEQEVTAESGEETVPEKEEEDEDR